MNDIKKILHQREPYLMVDEIVDLSDTEVSTLKVFKPNEFFIQGHFPGMPVFPGAMIQEFCTQSAGVLITKFYSPVPDYDATSTKGWALGVLNKVVYAKFLDIVKPEGDLNARIKLMEHQDNLFKFTAKVFQNEKLKAKLSFNLVNLADENLK